MARPNKQGLDYFPFDIDFFEDEKIEAISGEFGIKGELTAIKLLCAIYRNGYFILWNDMLKMKLLKNLPGISSELLENIVNRLVKWDFFDKNLFDSMGVLTSRGIQNRFFSISKRRNKSEEYPYLIINVDNNQVNVDNNTAQDGLMHTESTQRKGKESKVKEIKEEYNIPPLVPPREKHPKQLNTSESTIHPDGKKEKSCAKKESVSLRFPYSSDRFMLAWQTLIKSPKWRKKIQYTLQLALDKLANFEEEFAIMLVESAAANDWQGVVFPDTGEKYLKWKSSQKTKTSNFANYDNSKHYEQF